MIIFSKKTHIDDHPTVAPLVARRDELNEIASPLRAEHLLLAERYRKAMTVSPTFNDPDPAIARAATLAFNVLPQPKIDTPARLNEIEKSLIELDLAVEMLRVSIETARRRASAELCIERKAAFVALEKALARKIIDAANAASAYQNFLIDLEDASISSASLCPVTPDFLGARNSSDTMAFWLREVAARGTISLNDIPRNLSQ